MHNDYLVLANITGLDTTYNPQSVIHHYGHFAEDLSGVPTPDDYLALAQELGKSAARGDQGTHVKPRGNGDLEVYVDTELARRHSHYEGIFMAVRNRSEYGLLITMFAPTAGKAYFEKNDKRQLL